MTIGELFSGVKNYNFSAHTFSAIVAVAGIGYAASPELQNLVHDSVAHSSPWFRALIPAAIAIYARYMPSRRTTSVTSTVEPGDGAVTAAAASVEEKN